MYKTKARTGIGPGFLSADRLNLKLEIHLRRNSMQRVIDYVIMTVDGVEVK